MTATPDEQIIREILQRRLQSPYGNQSRAAQVALEALDRLMSRCVPESPQDWFIQEVSFHREDRVWSCQIYQLNEATQIDGRMESGEGPTIREAVTNAIKKIGNQA